MSSNSFDFLSQTQLRRERTEERRKMFQLVNNKKRGDDDYACMDSTLSKWRQIMPDNKMSSDVSSLVLGISEKLKPTGKHLDKNYFLANNCY